MAATIHSPLTSEQRTTGRRWVAIARAALAAGTGRQPDEFPAVTARQATDQALARTKAVR